MKDNICLQEQTNQVLDAMFERTVQAGEHVIDEGDDGDNFYVIERLVTKIFDIFEFLCYNKLNFLDKYHSINNSIFCI